MKEDRDTEAVKILEEYLKKIDLKPLLEELLEPSPFVKIYWDKKDDENV